MILLYNTQRSAEESHRGDIVCNPYFADCGGMQVASVAIPAGRKTHAPGVAG